MILKPHYHVATGKESKNKGKMYRCSNTGKDDPFGCAVEPAFDKKGKPLQL